MRISTGAEKAVRAALAIVLALGVAPGLAFAGEGAGAETGANGSQAPSRLTVPTQPAAGLSAQDQGDYTLEYSFDGSAKTATVTGYTGTAGGDLAIPATTVKDGATYTVTAIGASAFKNPEGETGFTGALAIPNTVTSIGASAFQGNTGLQGPLALPSGLTSLGSYAFADCRGIAGAVTIPAGLASIPDHCFYMGGSSGDRGLTGIAFASGSNLASIGESAFEGNWHVRGGVNLPDSVTSIGARAFRNTGTRAYDPSTSTTEPAGAEGTLHLPANLTSIGQEAFSICSFSGDLVIPSGVTSIGDGAFDYAGFTGSLTLPAGITTIPEKCFSECDFTGSLTLPSTITSIGESAFESCSTFSGDLAIPDGVTQIPDYAFSGFGNENAPCGELTLPSGLTSIGRSAFGGAGFTGALSIPDSVTGIGEGAFGGCRLFNSLTLPNNTGFTTIPNEAFGAESRDEPMGFSGTLVIPNSVTSIGDSAFKSCRFTSLELSASLESIGDGAFDRCQALAGTLTLPSSLNTVGERAFFFCDNLTGLTIGDGVTSIGDDAFYGCLKAGGNLTVPGSVRTIGEDAFGRFGENATQTGDLVIESGVESIGDGAFSSCKGFTSVTVPATVTADNVGSRVFDFCEGLETYELPETWTSVPDGIFWGCKNLKQVKIPPSATSIGDDAFRGCEGATGGLVIPATVTSIGSAAFYGCRSLAGELAIPASVTAFGTNFLGDGIFEGCEGFTSLAMNQACTTLPSNMFEGCTGLTGDMAIPSTVAKIETDVFRNCSGLTGKLTIPESVTTISGTPFYGTNFATIENNSDVTLDVSDISPAYNVSYEADGSNDGTVGKGTYTRVVSQAIDMTDNEDISITAPNMTYTGSEVTHASIIYGTPLSVKYKGKTLRRNTHYTLEYANNVDAGTPDSENPPTVTIVGLAEGGFSGSKSQTFTINPKSITPTIELSPSVFAYDGTAKTPNVTVKDGSTVIDKANYDYVLTNNTDSGRATVAVTMKGNYTGSGTAYFHITASGKASQTISASDKTVQAGKTVALGASTSGDGTLSFASSNSAIATVSTSGAVTGVKAGTATITVTAAETAAYAAATKTVTVTVTAAPAPTPAPTPAPGKQAQTITAENMTIQVKKTVALGAKASAGGTLSYQSSNAGVATVNAQGMVTGKKAGTAEVTITAAQTETHAAAIKTVTVSVKNANTLKTKTQSKKLASKTLKKKAQTFKASVIKKKGPGKLTYAKKSVTAKYKKHVTIAKSGKITVKKGAKKGKCVLTLTIKAAGNSKYMPATKTAKVTIAIK